MVGTNPNMEYDTLVDEINFKQFIRLIISYVRLILKRWYVVLFFSLLLGGIKYHFIGNIKPTYPARVKVLVKLHEGLKENKQTVKVFGQMISSRKLLSDVLLKEVQDSGKNKFLINIYLKNYFNLKPEELDKDIPSGFIFKHQKVEKFTSEERMVLNKVLDKLSTPNSDFSDGFVSISIEEELGFITINLATVSESLSILLLDELYKEVKTVLNNYITFSSGTTYNNFAKDTDSLSIIYKEAYYKLNQYRDRRERELQKEKPSSSTVKSLARKIYKLEVKAELAKEEYLVAVEQLKLAKSEMDQGSLLLHELEHTISPIDPYAPNAKKMSIKNAIFGMILGILIVILHRIFMNLYKELS
jgi:hypothetical protein